MTYTDIWPSFLSLSNKSTFIYSLPLLKQQVSVCNVLHRARSKHFTVYP